MTDCSSASQVHKVNCNSTNRHHFITLKHSRNQMTGLVVKALGLRYHGVGYSLILTLTSLGITLLRLSGPLAEMKQNSLYPSSCWVKPIFHSTLQILKWFKAYFQSPKPSFCATNLKICSSASCWRMPFRETLMTAVKKNTRTMERSTFRIRKTIPHGFITSPWNRHQSFW